METKIPEKEVVDKSHQQLLDVIAGRVWIDGQGKVHRIPSFNINELEDLPNDGVDDLELLTE